MKKDMGKQDKEKNKKGPGNGRDSDMMPDIEKLKKDLKSKRQGSRKDIAEEFEVEELEKEIDVLRDELDECKKIEDEYIDRIKRLQADYDNYRKRTIREHLAHIKRANKELISKLLPIMDNFEMALAAGKGTEGKEAEFYKGFRMIYDNLLELLKKENVSVIEPVGEEFDPSLCEAAVTESVDDVEEGKILEILRKGYRIDEFVLRPAVVKVCKKN